MQINTRELIPLDLSDKHDIREAVDGVSELKPINNLKLVFREIRDYFVGNVTGITRDEKIAQNIMRILFCKLFDEKNNADLLEFANYQNESLLSFSDRINSLFDKVKEYYADVFDEGEKLEIPAEQLSFIVSKLEHFSILNADRDVIGDAFEELIGTSFRGGEGQFFTPRNVVQMMIDVLQPKEGEHIIDPACGSGGFLAHTVKYAIANELKDFRIAGIDKDSFLAKIAKTYLALIGNQRHSVHCENSLDEPTNWTTSTQTSIKLGTFDVILTNPPFGAKIPVVGESLLSQYKLGRRWKNGTNASWAITEQLLSKQPPQVLFIERCLQLLREGGRMGIVLPEGIFGNPSDRYIWQYISSVASVVGVVSLPQETFQPSTHTKTSVLFLEKTTTSPNSVFMAIAGDVGHNKNGKPIYKTNSDGKKVLSDDLPAISHNFISDIQNREYQESRLGFSINYELLNSHIFIPEYYDIEIRRELDSLRENSGYKLVSIGELIDSGIIQIKRGNEIGSEFYGTGDIPFVRTSDIVNWEIKFDPIKSVSHKVYQDYKDIQDVRTKDILFVSDGTFLIGRTAMIAEQDTKIILQSHIKKIRVLNDDFIDPYYLFYLLNSKIVKKQVSSKTFVQATISTIGNRLREIVLPVSCNAIEINEISTEIREIICGKSTLREKIIQVVEKSV